MISRERYLLAGCVVLGVLLRLAYMVWADEGRYRQEAAFAADAQQYVDLAGSVATGEGYRLFGGPTSWRPPFYPFVLAGVMKLTDQPLFVMRLIQCLLGGLTCLPVYLVARRLAAGRAALLAAAGCAVSYELFSLNAYLMTETVFTYLVLALVASLVQYQARPSVAGSILAGVLLGLSILARPLFLLLPVVLVPWMVWIASRTAPVNRAVVQAAVLVAVAAVVVSPWTIRNSRVHGAFVPVTTDTGKMVYGSNSPNATGGTGGWYSRTTDYRIPPELEGGTEAEMSKRLVRAGLDYMVSHPGRTLALVPRKCWNMWRPWVDGASGLSTLLAAPFYVLVVAFAAVGVVLNRRQWIDWSLLYLVLLYVIGLHAILMSTVRYRYPVLPLLIVLAAAGLLGVLTRYRQGCGSGR